MKKIISIAISSLLLVSSSLSFSSCGTGGNGVDFSNYSYVNDVKADSYFNTASTVLIYYDKSVSGQEQKAKEVVSQIDKSLIQIENSLSTAIAGSDIYNFNNAKAGETISVSETAYEALKLCKTLYENTDGAYNPAVSALVDLWGFSPRFNKLSPTYEIVEKYDRENYWSNLPAQEYIEAFKSVSNFGDISLSAVTGEANTYFVTKPDNTAIVDGVEYSMKIDLGGFGKGYAADVAQELMIKAGFEYGYVSIGGSSISTLKCPKYNTGASPYDWSLKITYPEQMGAFLGMNFAEMFAQNEGVSTSGDYEHFYEKEGVKYCHIIDAQTGAPIQTGICSASIIGGSAAENDAYTTALSVMGIDKAIEFVNGYLTDRKVLFVYRNNEKERYDVYSNMQEKDVKLTSESGVFTLIGVGDGNGSIRIK